MDDRPGFVTLQLRWTGMLLLGAVILGPWFVLAALRWDERPEPVEPVSQRAVFTSEDAGRVHRGQPGPWGNLEYVRILIEPPESEVSINDEAASQTFWTFNGFSEQTLADLWSKAGLTDEQRQTLSGPEIRETTANGIRLRPSRELILGLSPASRSVIYSTLARFTENRGQNMPYRFRAAAVEEWFDNSGLHDDTIRIVQSLLYVRGASVLFSDLATVFSLVDSLDERMRLVKTLERQSTLLVKLRVNSDSDLNLLEGYWGRGPRAKDIRPLLESLPRSAAGSTIDITHLLPRFARSLLYTYPSPEDPGSHTFLDCHWTTLNFFNATPDRRFEDINVVSTTFKRDYHPITGQAALGDVLLLVNEAGTVLHSCVFVADDIVFTKNGASSSAPWILMALDDVVAYYPTEGRIDVQRYRARSLL